MNVSIVEVIHLDKKHPTCTRKRNHILIGYTHTLCGLRDFEGFGNETTLDKVSNLCEHCKSLLK